MKDIEAAGSAAPLDSVSKSKWYAGVDAAGLEKLNEVRETIDRVMDETVMTVARARLRIGHLLIEAREVFPGERQFGQWAKENVSQLAPRTRNTYMNMARQFGSAPDMVEQIGWSNARFLLSVDTDLLETRIQAGVEEVEALVSERKAAPRPQTPDPDPTPPEPDEAPLVASRAVPDPSPSRPSVIDLDTVIAKLLTEPVKARIAAINEGELDMIDELSQFCLVFGFGPELLMRRPAIQVWQAITEYTFSRVEHLPDEYNFTGIAAKRIEAHWAEGH